MNREDFPILSRQIAGRSLVYFDNAATSQKPQEVIEAMSRFYRHHNSNVHRALNPLAEEATNLYEGARQIVAKFIGAKTSEVIFTRGATEAINLVAKSWGAANLQAGDIVILTKAEHHANIVPWLQLKEQRGIKLVYIDLDKDGRLDLESARHLIKQPQAKLLAITQASNVLGVLNPVSELIKLARQANLVSLVDASQTVAHQPINFSALDCDFLVFSGHKLGGPTGIGVLVARESIIDNMPPFMGGGEMISEVYEQSFVSAAGPRKFEAGTPPIAEAIGLGAALNYLDKLGWEKIREEEEGLTTYFLQQLKDHNDVHLVGTATPRLPIFSLYVDGLHPHDAADLLGQEGIMLRAGFHCAQPLHDYLAIGPTLRASLSFYNTKEEIDYFFAKLIALKRSFSA